MKYDKYGQSYTTENELCELLYREPTLDISRFNVWDAQAYNDSVTKLWADMPKVVQYCVPFDQSIEQFDQEQQRHWLMPVQYAQMDIAQWVLDQCRNNAELQRVGEELLLYQERSLFPLLCYMKYLVDTMRTNGVVWGVGRGSSVSSYVLYKIGVHRIDSLFYDLDPHEFLK
jgi:DNA polymerase III alpha subunit